ncbi:MAG: TetR/AcrR family transcriptional regulator [Rhizobiales bacterium]|nr:TetR/AcrR family transcriptional regulator [Hyphomicrobiales bacterium]
MELEKGPKARTRRLMLDCAIQLMQNGITPSVSYVSEEAGVSRATAYRYFPNQAALVQQVIKHALGPIMVWRSSAEDVEVRVTELLEFSMPRIEAFEATFRAVLQLSLVQMAQRTAGTLDESEYQFKRGHRIALLARALEPLCGTIPDEDYQQLLNGLSVIFGIEAIAVMKDINGIASPKTTELVVWAAQAMVRQTLRKQEDAS